MSQNSKHFIRRLKRKLGIKGQPDRVTPEKSAHPPIFVRGLSRSGGTLLVTLLDSHPEIAMSYELYPNLLRGRALSKEPGISAEFGETDAGYETLDLEHLIEVLTTHKGKARKALGESGYPDSKVFVGRVRRSGIEHAQLVELLREHIADGDDVRNIEGQLRLIERVALEKMHRENKSRWGLKCSDGFESYLASWPNAHFINIVRDGRDVLASQQNTGSFKYSPAEVGRMWSKTHLKFRSLVADPNVNAHEVIYETLVEDPETEVSKLCAFLGVAYSDNMLSFHEQDLSIFQKTTGHLSIDRISRPIDTSKIGRWKNDLSKEDISAFNAAAGNTMKLFGYQ